MTVPESIYDRLLRWMAYINDRLKSSGLRLVGVPLCWNGWWTVRFKYVGDRHTFLLRLDIIGELIKDLKDEFLAQGFEEEDIDTFEAKLFRQDLEVTFRISATKLEIFMQGLTQA